MATISIDQVESAAAVAPGVSASVNSISGNLLTSSLLGAMGGCSAAEKKAEATKRPTKTAKERITGAKTAETADPPQLPGAANPSCVLLVKLLCS